MPAALFVKGILIGFSIAAPVGPIGVLCLRRSLADGPARGLATGLGAATADAVYGAIAGFGLTAVSGFLVGERLWLQGLGGAFLCYLGVRTWQEKSAGEEARTRGGSLAWAYGSTFLLTLTNPATILAFVAVFASLGLANAPSFGAASALVSGVFFGSAAWWLILSQSAGFFCSYLGRGGLRVINRTSGAVLLAFGLLSLILTVKHP